MQRKIINDKRHAHFITFSCYGRRKLLDDDAAKGIVVHFLDAQLKNHSADCMGFVVMPDHVHALVQFEPPGNLGAFIGQWKHRTSIVLKTLFQEKAVGHGAHLGIANPMWQPESKVFNVYSPHKAKEKMACMHNMPVNAGLVAKALDWRYSSARWYLMNRSVGVPLTRAM